ncbi:MAG: VanW family protein [Clostridia bacterium]|nr:VanW family protein [Clostridia bacterium]
MKMFQRIIALLLTVCMLPVLALAEDEEISMFAEGLVPGGLEAEGMAGGDGEDGEDNVALTGETATIDGMQPLYTTRVKPYVASGTAIRMRAEQSNESEVICLISAWEPITVYKVYPSYVLAEYNGNIGYVIRTWVDEEMTTIDPENTPPYGVVPAQFVATVTETVDVFAQPDHSSEVFDIHPGAGSKIAILEFVDGFAKVLYWRSYGYIDAKYLTDLVTVAQGNEPLSEDTPIAAFCSFFEYNTGKEGNDGRCKNIVRTCELMSRTMQPGESLDFNNQIGPYKRNNGYHPAPVLIDGGSQLGYGGGTCQSSSTLYNTIRMVPGITILQRRPHGPGCARYLPMHQDAAVGNVQLNLRFRNDTPYALRFLAESTGEGVLCIQIFREQ